MLDSYLFPDALELRHALGESTGPRFSALNDVIVNLLDEFAMVSFTPLDIGDEESIETALFQVDSAIQVGPGGGAFGVWRPLWRMGPGGNSNLLSRMLCACSCTPHVLHVPDGDDELAAGSCSGKAFPAETCTPQYGEDQDVRQKEYGDFPDEEAPAHEAIDF